MMAKINHYRGLSWVVEWRNPKTITCADWEPMAAFDLKVAAEVHSNKYARELQDYSFRVLEVFPNGTSAVAYEPYKRGECT